MGNCLIQRIKKLENAKREQELEDDGFIAALRPPEIDEKDWNHTDYMKAIEATIAETWKDFCQEEFN